MKKEIKDGIKKWDINLILDKDSNKVPNDNGYFGRYTVIKLNGKENIVFCNDSNAECIIASDEWFDEIAECSWSGDYRWNNDKPAIVRKGKKYALLSTNKGPIYKDSKKMKIISEWFESSNPKWIYKDSAQGYCVNCIVNGKNSIITENGNFINENPSEILKAVKDYSKEEIISKWINKGKPCAYQSGCSYKGSIPCTINKEKAIELLPKYNFGMGFYELAWRIVDGVASLVFNEYSVFDME